ncbi:MAG: DUF192 domain-containing protein [Tenericutes bacterium]|nr:DUF192 domain-containing protein [Mycoplasmatota bacterium]
MLNFNNLKVKEAKSFKDRLFGLMFKKNINYCLLFRNCKSIHTFFMLDKIDVVATDKNDNIIKVYKEVKPCRIIIAPKKTKNIYELPKKTL